MMSSGARALSAVVALAVHVRHRSPSRDRRSKVTLLASDAGHPLLYISMICQFFALAIRCSAPRQCSAWESPTSATTRLGLPVPQKHVREGGFEPVAGVTKADAAWAPQAGCP